MKLIIAAYDAIYLYGTELKIPSEIKPPLTSEAVDNPCFPMHHSGFVPRKNPSIC